MSAPCDSPSVRTCTRGKRQTLPSATVPSFAGVARQWLCAHFTAGQFSLYGRPALPQSVHPGDVVQGEVGVGVRCSLQRRPNGKGIYNCCQVIQPQRPLAAAHWRCIAHCTRDSSPERSAGLNSAPQRSAVGASPLVVAIHSQKGMNISLRPSRAAGPAWRHHAPRPTPSAHGFQRGSPRSNAAAGDASSSENPVK